MGNRHFPLRASVLTVFVGALALVGYSFTNAQTVAATACGNISLSMDKLSYISGETINFTYRCADNVAAASL